MRSWMWPLAAFVLGTTAFFSSLLFSARADEVSLFDSRGSPVAYIDTDDELTIYLWSGTPVAYLEDRDAGAFHVWRFNGKHLGWFEKGAIWEQSGGATCVVSKAFPGITSIEPIKSIKQIKPIKSIREIAPIKPLYTGLFGSRGCLSHLVPSQY